WVALHLTHQHHALAAVRATGLRAHQANQVRSLQVREPPLDLDRIDRDHRRRALRSVQDPGHLTRPAYPARRALAGLAPGMNGDLDRIHANFLQTNSELIEASSCVRRIASASSAATGSTVIFASSDAEARSGMVSVTTSSSSPDVR